MPKVRGCIFCVYTAPDSNSPPTNSAIYAGYYLSKINVADYYVAALALIALPFNVCKTGLKHKNTQAQRVRKDGVCLSRPCTFNQKNSSWFTTGFPYTLP